MALELYDIMKRYNDAKNIEDDMMKDIELQKIQAEFLSNNEQLEVQERRIKELEDDLMRANVDIERLKDSNAELRLNTGSYIKKEETQEIVEEDDKDKIIVVDNFSEIAKEF